MGYEASVDLLGLSTHIWSEVICESVVHQNGRMAKKIFK